MPASAPRSAQPSKSIFDPFNSSATGHQRADNRLSGSTSWRDSRTLKLNQQFGSGAGGGQRTNDTVGAGSLEFGLDGRTANGGWEKGAKGLRRHGQRSIQESLPRSDQDNEDDLGRPKKRSKAEDPVLPPSAVVNPFTPFVRHDGTVRETSWTSHESSPSHGLHTSVDSKSPRSQVQAAEQDEEALKDQHYPQIFANLTFYVNGSAAPLISDHKLKQVISNHGGRLGISLARRTVTHIIIGRPSSRGGTGGGLAGSKLHKEITQMRGNKLKYVTAEWVTESVRAGKRLPESRFEAMHLAPRGVGSLTKIFEAKPKEAG